jgi:23S rRNA pseudouridine1911/1915/1917 synthase
LGEPDTLTAAPDAAGRRLDRYLAARRSDLSRARIQVLIDGGEVLVDGARTRPSHRLRGGETIAIHVPPPVEATPRPEDIPLRVLHEDACLLVVHKDAGLAMHPGAGRASGTLVNALLHHVEDLSGIGGELRPGLVHRLDKGTSGLVLVAKDDASHRFLAAQFADRSVRKEYLAVVLGQPKAAAGRIERPIGRDPVHRKKMKVDAPRARHATSEWTVERRLDGAALVRVRILTGRTHQIRVHLASIGHPVAGDRLYGARAGARSRRDEAQAALEALERPALHATRLRFIHPDGRTLEFESPLPADLQRLVAALEER